MIGWRGISMTISFCTMHTWVVCKVSHQRTEQCVKVCQTCCIIIKARNPTLRPSPRTTVSSLNSQGETQHRRSPSKCTITYTCGKLRASENPRSLKSRQSMSTWNSCIAKNKTVSKSNSKKMYKMKNGLCRIRNGHLEWGSPRQPESHIEIIMQKIIPQVSTITQPISILKEK